MREFGFECRLCAHLEGSAVVARQLGAGVRQPGRRVVDILCVEPGPGFDDRTAITDETIPEAALAADVGTGRFRPWTDAFAGLELPTERCRGAMERAVEIDFLESRRERGRTLVRRAARYPADWFGRLVAIENKPDLDRPGDLARQLRTDASLALCDAVVLATESHVTGAHLHRLPDPVGVWQFDSNTGDIEIVRESEPLPVDRPGVELVAEHPGRTDVRVVSAAEKARRRRVIAERAYGKGWRTFDPPGCDQFEPTPDALLPHCTHFDRLVDPSLECGPDCPGYGPSDVPDVDRQAVRDRRSPWVRDPPGRAREQGRLDRF